MLVDNTPVETYYINGVPILVKREDLCCPDPGPSFSKLRGVYSHINNRPEAVIGVLDTFHSKAGWAVAYTCQALGKRCVNFWPEYKKDRGGEFPSLRPQQLSALGMGAGLIALQAGRSAVLYHQAKKHLTENYPSAYMMPNALKLPESVTENAAEAVRTMPRLPLTGTVVISISSGTVASGLIQTFSRYGYDIVLHMGYSRSVPAVEEYISKMSRCPLRFITGERVRIVDEGYEYKQSVDIRMPFPANPHYDAKAWLWLSKPGVVESLRQPVVFWNIGA